MPDIFISYAREDERTAERLGGALKARGWSVFWDRNVPAGPRFDRAIAKELHAARCVVVLWSETSVESEWVIEEAAHGRKREVLVPARLQDVDPPFGFGHRNYVNLFGWTSGRAHDGFDQLVASIARIMDASNCDGAADDPNGPGPKPQPGRAFDQHGRLAIRLLAKPGADRFFEALKDELASTLPSKSRAGTPKEVVDQFSNAVLDQDRLVLFDIVHSALVLLDDLPNINPAARRASEEAAAALYCLAACRLVDCAAHSSGDYVVHVPLSASIVYAVITTALFGGELHLRPAGQDGLPDCEYIYEINIPAGGHLLEQDFERAAYVAIVQNTRDATTAGLEVGELTKRQKEALRVRLGNIKRVYRKSLALVIPGTIDGEHYRRFATEHEAPIMIAGETAKELLKIDPDTLLEQIAAFCRDFRSHREKEMPNMGAQTMAQDQEKSANSSTTSYNFGDHANVSFGNHSPAGRGGQVQHREGIDASELAPLLRELMQSIKENAPSSKHDELTGQVSIIEEETKKQKPDGGRVKQALDFVLDTAKKGGEAFKGGDQIAATCNRLYEALSPLIGSTPPQ